MKSDKYNEDIKNIFEAAYIRYKQGERVESKDKIPTREDQIPLEDNLWLRVDEVVCVYIDMKDSTKLSAQKHDKSTASIYQYFTDTAVRVLNYYGASYIDVRGDGAFGLFDKNKLYHAFCAAVTFKTFCEFNFGADVIVNDKKVSCHIGMDTKTVLVKRIGLRNVEGKTDKQNEVWAGKPVNMASKLASRGEENQIIVSERIYNRFLKDNSKHVLGHCCNSGKKLGLDSKYSASTLWDEEDVSDDSVFDFGKIHKLNTSGWCDSHGQEYEAEILTLD